MSAVTAQESLRRLTALSHFSLEQLERLAAAARVLDLASGEIVVRRGDASGELYGLTRGALAIQRDTPHGDFILARLRPGDLVGEANFIDPEERSSDVVTTDESEVVALDDARLREICAANRRFELALYWAIWNSMSRKLRIAGNMLSHYFAPQSPGDEKTSVGQPRRGEELAVDIRAKRDFFLQLDLSHMEANFLASLSKGERFHEGDTIFRQGDAGEQLYFILNGQVRISKAITGAGEEALAILKRGEVFGEMALIDGRPRTADAVAHDDEIDLLVIPASVLSGILDFDKLSSPRLLRMLCKTVARRLRELDEKLVGWYLLSGGESTVITSHPRDLTNL